MYYHALICSSECGLEDRSVGVQIPHFNQNLNTYLTLVTHVLAASNSNLLKCGSLKQPKGTPVDDSRALSGEFTIK